MSTGTSIRLRPYEVALLRGGPRAAVTVAVVALHLRGDVEAGRPGRLRTSEASSEAAGQAPPPQTSPPSQAPPAPLAPASSPDPASSPAPLPPLAEAVRAALARPAGLPQVRDHADVRAALAELQAGLRAAGLLRAFPPHRTRTARRALDALSAEHPLPTSRKGLPESDALMAVALHGEPALHVLVPRFALRAGLITRAEVTEGKGFHSRSPRGGGTGGTAYSCGGGGGGSD
ncbi:MULTISPECIES: TIGR04222 domain-containing membrane protein [Streptomyces]|uniref:TIGR04222 domain-containing membrane protein n=1 Tax=Streptomyces galilaeus TaxID=33899 RepID=A0ABW9IHH2_STRGJ